MHNKDFAKLRNVLSHPKNKVWGIQEAITVRDWLDNFIWYSGLAQTSSTNALIVSRNRVLAKVLRMHNFSWNSIADFLSVTVKRAQQYQRELMSSDSLFFTREGAMLLACFKNQFIKNDIKFTY